MKKNTLLSVLLTLMILAAGCQRQEESSPLSAALSELSGAVNVKQAGAEAFAPATAAATLDVNGQVQTGDDGRVRLDLSSGTIIRIAPSSLFTLLSNDEVEGGLATKIKLEVGKIFVILSGGSADVETPSGVASVRGSYMKVEVDPETLDIYVTCLEGDCTAGNPAGSVSFTNGEKVILFHRDPVTGNWTVPTVEPMTPEEFREWLDNNPEARELFEQAMATVTAQAQPRETAIPTSTATLTATPESTSGSGTAGSACFTTIQPETGASLPKQGRVDFAWEEQNGAALYVVTFVNENGYRAAVETTNTSTAWFIEIFPAGGQYSWFVTAYGADGNELCSTSPVTFSKPQGDPTPKPTQEDQVPSTEEVACTIEQKCDYLNEACFVGFESQEYFELCD